MILLSIVVVAALTYQESPGNYEFVPNDAWEMTLGIAGAVFVTGTFLLFRMYRWRILRPRFTAPALGICLAVIGFGLTRGDDEGFEGFVIAAIGLGVLAWWGALTLDRRNGGNEASSPDHSVKGRKSMWRVVAVALGIVLSLAVTAGIGTSIAIHAIQNRAAAAKTQAVDPDILAALDPRLDAGTPIQPQIEKPSEGTSDSALAARIRSVLAQNAEAEPLVPKVQKRLERAGLPNDAGVAKALALRVVRGQTDTLPPTGVISRSPAAGLAPLEVRTAPGSNYFLKVRNWTDHEDVLTAFIRGGEKFETDMPLGKYEVCYSVGTQWYGPILDFGRFTAFRCESSFEFTADATGYDGHTIELIFQRNGNLETGPMAGEDF